MWFCSGGAGFELGIPFTEDHRDSRIHKNDGYLTILMILQFLSILSLFPKGGGECTGLRHQNAKL
jgi:hypothetical protein